ncbi:MAG: helix-turn-helix transcriptional regulator [Clostridium sp.]|nr:helix-turn-helix transcriptional regulator [Clostridium sp.]
MYEKLTKKEIEVCKCLIDSKGMFNRKEIAFALGLCFSTVNTHLNSIYGKLLINSKAELVYLLCTDKSILTNNEKG